MITNFWKQISLFCESHPENKLTLELNKSQTGYDYVCGSCGFRIPVIFVEKAIDKMSDDITSAEFNDIQLDITGSQYVVNKYRFFVKTYQPFGEIILTARSVVI